VAIRYTLQEFVGMVNKGMLRANKRMEKYFDEAYRTIEKIELYVPIAYREPRYVIAS
jgi:hypothetical protein